ncbi:brachyurin-like [Culex pipiens pallens]|uniref:brachyurin-like n=1 Tax=Culex pipiens pallens TaxID=42434 RepID=UPI001952E066|nr:brachyurin-like [Culex pipiens pallens]
MKSSIIFVAVLALASAEWIDIDWSQVRPIEDFDHYWARLPAKLQYLRKLQPDRRVTFGQEATPGQFPYQAVVLISVPGGTALCGGSILSKNYILTAAHCVVDATGGTVIVGAHNYATYEPSQQRIAFGLSGIQYHSGYNPEIVRNDVATIRLNSPLTLNDRVKAVRLPASGDYRQFAGATGTVSGHGRTESGSTSNVLRFTSNPILSQQECLDYWQWPEIIEAQNVCLDGVDGRSACNGDSGGPLTVVDAGSSIQVGIVSFGNGYGCTLGTPSVFARVTYFKDWILQHSDVQQ